MAATNPDGTHPGLARALLVIGALAGLGFVVTALAPRTFIPCATAICGCVFALATIGSAVAQRRRGESATAGAVTVLLFAATVVVWWAVSEGGRVVASGGSESWWLSATKLFGGATMIVAVGLIFGIWRQLANAKFVDASQLPSTSAG
ncbi:MAG TPA: hypothetical protein VFU07_06705 [Candidatus Lumbricidophila sp.]|nr:hypothetical protein [Candidatus Lumbricidophila sp.]